MQCNVHAMQNQDLLGDLMTWWSWGPKKFMADSLNHDPDNKKDRTEIHIAIRHVPQMEAWGS